MINQTQPFKCFLCYRFIDRGALKVYIQGDAPSRMNPVGDIDKWFEKIKWRNGFFWQLFYLYYLMVHPN